MRILCLFYHSKVKVSKTGQQGGGALDDAALVTLALQGDKQAEAMLYRRHASGLLGLVVSMLRNQEDAEDVVQDSFVTAFNELSKLRNHGAFRPWLYRIAVHRAHRLFRRRKLKRLLGFNNPEHLDFMHLEPSPECSPEIAAIIKELSGHLSTLSDDVRTCWILRYVEGWPLEEIAQSCDCSLATAKRRIALAMSHIRSMMVLELDEVDHG